MPPCKNDPKSHYKGSEPSPKGYGFAAHAESIGTRKKGTDGTMYEVKERSNGAHYWGKVRQRSAVRKTAGAESKSSTRSSSSTSASSTERKTKERSRRAPRKSFAITDAEREMSGDERTYSAAAASPAPKEESSTAKPVCTKCKHAMARMGHSDYRDNRDSRDRDYRFSDE